MDDRELLKIIEKAAKEEETYLSLSCTILSELPPEIGQLTQLESLNLSGNKLRRLPPEIGQLSSLQYLDLCVNQLSELPPEIGRLTQLKSLYLSRNKLRKLPPEIGQLTKLKSLTLHSNELSELPPEIGKLIALRCFGLMQNQLSQLPQEIQKYVENPREAAIEIPRYYRQILEQSIDRLYEAKLLIVGEGGAGKTSLAKKIENQNYELVSTEHSTEGIDILELKFPFQDGKDFRINIWDFGGQEIYHATHQFFLTKRSFYILVADSRKEDTDFFYWLNVVELLSDNSPILIVKNEKQDRKREINERQLRGEFLNLKEVLATNLADNRGLLEVKQALQDYIAKLPHVGNELPKTWVDVRKALETDARNHITLEEYLTICTENGFTRRDDALQLGEYLHDLGVCLHFQEDNLLRKTVILQPTWGTDAVYRVLDNPKVIQNLGQFNREDLAEIWYEEQYATMRPELLRLMMNFKLCYEIPGCPDNYIAPQLLSPNQPNYTWSKDDNLLLRYSYEFMPKGIVTRFIVEMHQWIEKKTCVWKTGVVLSKDGSRAEIVELYHRNQIHVRVSGKRRRDLLTTVRHELDKIHNSYDRLKYKTLVPCNCKTCKPNQAPHFYPLQTLHKFRDDSQYWIQCQHSYKMVDVRGLIDDITKDSSRSSKPMSDSDSNIQINNPEVVHIIDKVLGDAIGKQYNYANDIKLKKSVADICQILKALQDRYPDATEADAREFVEVEFEEVRTEKPAKWKMFRRNLLDPERWANGGKAALIEAANSVLEDSVFGKAAIAFLEEFSEDE